MKQFLTILFILGVFCSVFSQEEITVKERIGLGIYFSPEVNNVVIQNKSTYQSVQPKIGFSVGAEMNFTFGEHWILRAGFGFGFKQFRYINDNYVLQNYYHPEQGLISPTVTAVYEAKFQETQIPLSFHYKFSERFFVGVGTEFILPISFPSSWHVDGYSGIDYKKPYNLIDNPKNFVLSASAGYRFKLAGSFYLLLEPAFRFYLKKNRLDIDTYSHFYSIGLKTTFWLGGK